MSEDHQWLMQLAGDLALRAAGAVRQRFGSSTARLKQDRTLITEADQAAQQLMLDELAERYPGHAVLAEETIKDPSRHGLVEKAELCWVIDPLDGTRNFARGLPIFSTVIAVLQAGRPVAAAVADVMTGQLYRAAAGGGAYLDGRLLSVRRDQPGQHALVAVPSGRDRPTPPAVLQRVARFTLRNLGSSALHLAMVASGALDGAFCLECKLWDVAAGALLVAEAGGKIT
ncbi:MAG: inositol monophosphatase family protein, partial [Phycisphaerae bacterium]